MPSSANRGAQPRQRFPRGKAQTLPEFVYSSFAHNFFIDGFANVCHIYP